MKVAMIVAVSENGGIGLEGQLPWKLHSDLKLFRTLTMTHHLIMGRKTFETIDKPLTGRQMIVLTHDPNYQIGGALVTNSIEKAIQLAQQRGDHEAFIIGGGEIYAQAIDFVDTIYLTRVHAVIAADTFFPELDPAKWQLVKEERHSADAHNEYDYTFQVYERVSDKTG